MHRSFRWRAWLPLLLLACGLAGTILLELGVERMNARFEHERFLRLCKRTKGQFEERLMRVAAPISGGRGLYYGTDGATDRKAWRSLYSEIRPFIYPCVVGLGLVRRVPRQELERFAEKLNREAGFPIEVERDGQGSDAAIVVIFEPAELNAQVLGLDITKGTTRYPKAILAARQDRMSMTRRINLIQGGTVMPGFLYFLPLYRAGAPLDTEEQRLEACEGWAYGAVRADLLLAETDEITARQIHIELFDGDNPAPERLIYEASRTTPSQKEGQKQNAMVSNAALQSSMPFVVYDQSFTLRFTSLPAFDAAGGKGHARLFIYTVGTLTSLLISAVIWFLIGARNRAMNLANAMTRELRQEQQTMRRISAIAKATKNGVLILSPDLKIEWVNEAFTHLLGYSFEEALHRDPLELLNGPETDPESVVRIQTSLARQETLREEILNYRKDGTPVWLWLEIQPLFDAEGKPAGFMGMQTDITERHSFEQALENAKNLAEEAKLAADQANQAKGAFLATMSHEIRTPMNGVIGMTSLLLDTPLSSLQREYVETIRNSGDTLLNIINDILDFSKIESGKLELERHPFRLSSVVEGVVDLLGNRAASKNLELVYSIDPTLPETLGGDSTRLGQILINLVGNAIKFTERGAVEMELARAVDTEDRPTPKPGTLLLRLSVKDSGIGISAEAQKRLFDSFVQADTSTTRRYGGTGLGLAISKKLTELMGGKLWVQSEPGKGSVFSCHLELSTDVPAIVDEESPDPRPLAGRRLLIVDDNPACRRMLVSLASRWGMKTIEAEGPFEALGLLKQGLQVDYAVVDAVMPDMDGEVLAEHLSLKTKNAFPILLLVPLGHRLPATLKFPGALAAKPVKSPSLLRSLLSLGEEASQSEVQSPNVVEVETDGMTAIRQRDESILLAEDNPVNQRVILHMLRRAGYKAKLAVNGKEAVRAHIEERFDFILMDMQMPEMDGLEATRQIRAQPHPGVRPPWIIALTANAMHEDKKACEMAGMNDFLSKPLKTGDLETVLERAGRSREKEPAA